MELQFKARARKNKMLGLWAAGLLGKTGADAEAYARDIVMADFEKPGEHDVIHTLMHDLAAAGKPHEEHTIRKQGERFLVEADPSGDERGQALIFRDCGASPAHDHDAGGRPRSGKTSRTPA